MDWHYVLTGEGGVHLDPLGRVYEGPEGEAIRGLLANQGGPDISMLLTAIGETFRQKIEEGIAITPESAPELRPLVRKLVEALDDAGGAPRRSGLR